MSKVQKPQLAKHHDQTKGKQGVNASQAKDGYEVLDKFFH